MPLAENDAFQAMVTMKPSYNRKLETPCWKSKPLVSVIMLAMLAMRLNDCARDMIILQGGPAKVRPANLHFCW